MYPDAKVEKIGLLSLQHDWHESLREGGKSVWTACSKQGVKSVYGEIGLHRKSDGQIELEPSTGFQGQLVNKNVMKVNTADGLLTSYFFAPHNSFRDVHRKAVRCLDVSPSGGSMVTCGDDGGLYVSQTSDGAVRRTLEGHIGDTTHCRFFPSGLVVLSGGMDMRLKIWSVEDGSCPVTLTGHSGAITGTAIIDKGRNIISCSRDGTARLWDCGSAQCLRKIETATSAVINNCCVSRHHGSVIPNEEKDVQHHENECGTSDKLLLLARDDGNIDGADMNSKNTIFSLPCHSAVNDCCFINENTVVAGLQDGKMVFYDLRNTHTPQRICQYGKSSINCVRPFPGESVLVGRNDGSCSCIRNIPTLENNVTMELNGPNCDPIYSLSYNGNFVYTACRDSIVRKYKLQLM